MTTTRTTTRRTPKQTGRVGTRLCTVSEFVSFCAEHDITGRTHVDGFPLSCHRVPDPFTLASWCERVRYVTVQPVDGTRVLLVFWTRKPTTGEVTAQ